MTDILYASTFGVDPSLPNNLQALQKAVSAACASQAILQLPAGVLNIDGTITGNDACIIRGTGSGGGGWTTSGTVINQMDNASTTFSFTCIGGVVLEDFAISMPLNGQGTGISIISGVTNNCNRGTRIENIRTLGGGVGISLFYCANYTISDCCIYDFCQNGISLGTDMNLPDTGDSMIRGCTIWNYNTNLPYSCLFIHPQGGLSIIGNKLLGAQIGILLQTSAGPTGTLLISGNSIEAQTVAHIYSVNGGYPYGFLSINGNQMQSYNGPTFQTGICITNDATQYMSDVVITNNIIRDAPVLYAGIYIGGAKNVLISGNIIDLVAISSQWIVKGNASNVTDINNMKL